MRNKKIFKTLLLAACCAVCTAGAVTMTACNKGGNDGGISFVEEAVKEGPQFFGRLACGRKGGGYHRFGRIYRIRKGFEIFHRYYQRTGEGMGRYRPLDLESGRTW